MRYADCPTTEASVEIDAPADVVWRLITDIRVPIQFSSELVEVQWLDDVTEPAVGARFRGTSHHPAAGSWQTTCFVTACEPGTRFSWSVSDADFPAAVWTFEMTPTDGRVLLTQRMQIGPAPSGLSPAIEAMPDKEERIIERRLDEHRTNMLATLRGIKALAEEAT
jgi:uncharacterized membrane protein